MKKLSLLLLMLVLIGLLTPAVGGTIDVSSLYLVPFRHGDTLVINFGIWNYGLQAMADGFSPYPTGLNLLVIGLAPSNPLQDFAFSAQLQSNDGMVVVPIGGIPLS